MTDNYTRWCNQLTTEEFHQHVAGNLPFPGPRTCGSEPDGSPAALLWLIAIGGAWSLFACIGIYTVVRHFTH